jgi:hypothetical protein
MGLSNDLISQFAKVVNTNNDNKPTDETVYGTVKIDGDSKIVELDGSNYGIPLSSTTDVNNGDRVTVMIKDHTAVVTGNLSTPAINKETTISNGDNTSTKISDLGIVVADKVSTEIFEAEQAKINNLYVNVLEVDEVTAKSAVIESLKATEGEFKKLSTEVLDATFVNVDGELKAKSAVIDSLKATQAEFRDVQTDFINVKGELAANKASIEDLTANKADITWANIDFSKIDKATIGELLSQSGIIKDLTVSSGTITGELVGVTIKGDLIEGNTIVADKLVVLGDDGLYYKLNLNGETVEGEQTEYNSLNGSIITAKSVTAEKISVDDLVAFGATIGGFKLTDHSFYSGVKNSVDNTTEGVYMDTDAQFAIGDGNNYLKLYKDDNDNYKLDISASSLTFASSSKSVETLLSDVDKQIDDTKDTLSEELENQKSDYEAFLTKFKKYIRFMEDENGNPSDTAMTIGSGDSAITLEIDNEKGLIFKKNGIQFGSWDGVDFYTGNIIVEVNERAQFGNFAEIPRSDGSLSLLKVR